VSQGLDVTCLVRTPGNPRFIGDLPVSIVQGDVKDPESLRHAFAGHDVIVHVAARVGDWGSYADFYETNVLGTLNVLQEALRCSAKRVILTGSVASYGEEDHPDLKDETSPYNSHYPYFIDPWLPSGMNHYRDTKALCTQLAEEFTVNNKMDVVVLEPVWVYGENEFSSGFFEYLKSLKTGMRLMPGSKCNTFHVIYAGDLARAFYLACTCNLEGFQRIIIGNPQPEKMYGIYRMLADSAGLPRPLLLPRWVSYSAGLALECIWTLLRMKKPPLLTRARVNMFYDSIGYSTEKAYSLLGFKAMTPLSEGIDRTVNWYKGNKFL
jgi:nucleoside-diphosphate-sugar epimerase